MRLALIIIPLLVASLGPVAADDVSTRRICVNNWLSSSSSEKGSTQRGEFVFKCMQAAASAGSGGAAMTTGKQGGGGSTAQKPAASGPAK